MRVVTRKQHTDFDAAQAVPLQAGKRLRAPSDLDALAALITFNPAHGAFVDSLDILIRSTFRLNTLRRSLTLLPNLTDLILIAPRIRSSSALRGVHLPHLEYFRTDLPHAILVEFLAIHPTVAELDLVGNGEHQGAVECPLQTVNLGSVKNLHGPVSCVVRLASQGVVRLTMQLDGSASSSSTLLRTITPPLVDLHTLILDIQDDDFNVLESIAIACPSVRKLKLTEKALYKNRRSQARRAYNDAYGWSKALKKLPELEELLLRTSTSLVRRAASWQDEHAVVTTWVNGRSRTRSRATHKPHPMLYHIGIWYGSGPSGGGCVTHWSKPSGTWERTVSIRNAPADLPFI